MSTDAPAVCRCAKCCRPLQVVCPAGCENPDEALRKTNGARQRDSSRSAPERLRQKEIGETLHAARIRLGLSRDDLAAKIHRAPKSFSVWEAGGERIGTKLVPELARILKISPAQLTNELHGRASA